jgi:hypothetical protein
MYRTLICTDNTTKGSPNNISFHLDPVFAVVSFLSLSYAYFLNPPFPSSFGDFRPRH